MTNETLDTLPSELLIIIFDYCSAFDLIRLSQVCKRFYQILRANTPWIRKSKQPLVTNQVSERFCRRCNPLLCSRTKWRVTHNWQYGKYTKKTLYSQKRKMMPTLQLTDDALWWCAGDQLCAFERSKRAMRNICFNIVDLAYDFNTFVLTKDFIITGESYGFLRFWTYDDTQSSYCIVGHLSDINDIDVTSDILLSGSNDRTIKIWPAPTSDNIEKCIYDNYISTCIPISDRVWSVAIDPTGKKCAVGSSGTIRGTPPLHIFDITRYDTEQVRINHEWKHGSGILDMVWEDPHILLSCGYDTYIRKWDLRSGKCVKQWPDPTDATLYCISSDYQYTMITGTQYNCAAVLWDQRQTDYVQLYFMKLPGADSRSPIYSLEFDSSHLYCATDQCLVELQFSGSTKESFNYKGLK